MTEARQISVIDYSYTDFKLKNHGQVDVASC